MKKTILSLALCICLLLCSCAKPGAGGSGNHISVYRVLRPEKQTTGELIRAEEFPIAENLDPLQGAVNALTAEPYDDALMSALPDTVKVISASQGGSEVTVNMSASYKALAGIEKTIADYCITLTMCSLPDVDCVSIGVGNEIIESRLRSDDVLLRNTVESAVEADIRLYFPRLAGDNLGFEYRGISLDEDNSAERSVIDALLLGPEDDRFAAALPDGTVLLSIGTQDGVCSVSLSDSFLTACNENPTQAHLWIYSVVNSLASLASISSVQILIDGKIVQSAGACDISNALTKNEMLVGSAVA